MSVICADPEPFKDDDPSFLDRMEDEVKYFDSSGQMRVGRLRGMKSSADIYGKLKDGSLKSMPPAWTMRGHMERHREQCPIAIKRYDTGQFPIPSDPVKREKLRKVVQAEWMILYDTLAPFVLGKRLEIDDTIFLVYIIVMYGEMEGQGLAGRYLDSLPRNKDIIVPEVVPESKMPGMLKRRGFFFSWALDEDDEKQVFFPAWIRPSR